ncbi:hypothetical protein EVAR_28699_1 [Eumeta japonica]|uniref:Endonuclease/exonuclease/phosphatase domain-containing protein n=1 Tax=Eumeta variegata TaxID=151549 RepID=A0A4C1V6A0_EUMVA|nr:hypothetical protein EVAR_28699_1 [Eumeta japonica]
MASLSGNRPKLLGTLKPGSHFRMPGIVRLRDDRSDGYSGAYVFIRNHTPFSPVGIPAHGGGFQAVAVKVEGTTFLFLYIASPSSLILNELEAILYTLVRPYIVLGDLNCHHILWSCDGVDSADRTLVDIIWINLIFSS